MLVPSERQEPKIADPPFLCYDNNISINQQLVFRIRIIQTTGFEPKAVVALKGNAVLVDGIAHVEEVR